MKTKFNYKIGQFIVYSYDHNPCIVLDYKDNGYLLYSFKEEIIFWQGRNHVQAFSVPVEQYCKTSNMKSVSLSYTAMRS